MTARDCLSCGTANEADARFCEGCGTPLERSCAGCGTAASASARFCRACGAPLEGPIDRTAESPVRKTVTVMFADLAGSTGFEERVDAETAREVLGRYHDLLRSTAERHRAGVTKYIGDGFMAVWGVPEVGADDAVRAVEAAVELQNGFAGFADRIARAHGATLALRVAVNTGELVVGSGDADLVGDALNVCARLESECPHGQVVVGEETWRSTRGGYRFEPLGRVQVKGRAAPVAVYQWLGYPTEVSESAPFVGRSDELHRLQTALAQAIDNRCARLVTVIGEPGVGKSRLSEEFASRSSAGLLRVRCSAEGTVALGPFIEMLRTRDLDAELPDGLADRDRILRGLRGITTGLAGSVEETFWALRRYIETLAGDDGLILILDDIQWADALLLDLVEHLAEWAREAPLLMLALTRGELRESRPDLVAVGGWVSDAIRLHGLEPDATAELAAQVLGADRLPPDLLSRLPISTGGNPLFVRELVGMLVHDGVLVGQHDGWRLTIDVDAISVPPTIQALLASRLERIDTIDRRTLEVASVIGTEFSPAALATLAGLPPVEVRASLDRLRRLELAQPSGTYNADEPLWRFHHVLVRDVAYRRLLKSDRADLHERLVNWLLDRAAGSAVDTEVARHLEAAYGYRCDLGVHDAVTAELALRSARGYLASARRALDRDELVSAGKQATRGSVLAADDGELRGELLLVGCEALLSARDVAAAAPLVDDLERTASDALAPWATCYRCQYLAYTDPARLPEADDLLRGVIDEFTRRGDASGLAKAHRVRASARARMGRIGDAEADLFEALIAARRSADHRQITAALVEAPNAALWGPSPAPKAGGRCLDVVRMQRMTTAAPSLEATSLRCLAVLELLRGRPDKARTMLADARQIVADLGVRHALMETELFAGIIELLAGDPIAAEPYFRTALDGLDALGLGVDAGQAAALLARSLLAQGRIDEAEPFAAESEQLAGRNLKTAILWRAVRAEILAAQGHYDSAIGVADEAVTLAEGTDLVLDHADACLALSRVLGAAGDHLRAAEARSQGQALYAAKEAPFLAAAQPPVGVPASAETVPPLRQSLLATGNRASRTLIVATEAHRLTFADDCGYEDRRKLGGEPIIGSAGFAAAVHRKYEQYPHLDIYPLALRGETLAMARMRWWDDAGNETGSVDLYDVGDDGAIRYLARFDEDDLRGAHAELERRYYAGEGAPVADATRLRDFEAAEAALGAAELVAVNRASVVSHAVSRRAAERDADGVVALYSPHVVYEDHRRLSGDPIDGIADMRAGVERLMKNYSHFEFETVAVRGETMCLGNGRRWDEYGNWASNYEVVEVDDDGLTVYHGRFDEDDFWGAYSELDRRYFAGEGAAFAANGRIQSLWIRAISQGDIETVNRTSTPQFRWHAAPNWFKPEERTVADMFRWREERGQQLAEQRHWVSVQRWLAADCAVGRGEIRGTGRDGEDYRWAFAYVAQLRDGLVESVREFDIDDERAAFDYAEAVVDSQNSRLPYTNRASLVSHDLVRALNKSDLNGAVALLSAHRVYDDRRRLSGDPIDGPPSIRMGVERVLRHYNHFALEPVAVRGDTLFLGVGRQWDESGNAVSNIELAEINAEGRISYHARFDEDDFLSAYAELEQRYYAGEGAEFATGGLAAARVIEGFNRGNLAAAQQYCAPGFRWYAPAAALTARERSIQEVYQWMKERGEQVTSQRYWIPVIRWLSPECAVSRNEISALGPDCEDYRWTRFCVTTIDRGLPMSVHQFETEQEAFAYAEALLAKATAGRLPVSNRADRTVAAIYRSARARDAHAVVDLYADALTFDDRRLMPGAPIGDRAQRLANTERMMSQYPHFEVRTLAVRGEQLTLFRTDWSDDAGNQAAYLHVIEVGEADLVTYEARFEQDDFSSAYCELEKRYYAGEGLGFAPGGATLAEQLRTMTSSLRTWFSAVHWLSEHWVIARQEREGTGPNGERYSPTRICVCGIHDGQITSLREFDAGDEDAAFAEAESRMCLHSARLEIANRAAAVRYGVLSALQCGNLDEAVRPYSMEFEYGDRRLFSGDAINSRPGIRAAYERMCQDYNHFDGNVLAVRGERLGLGWYRCGDDAGNETTGLLLGEIDEHGQIIYECRFDEDDFARAHRELDERYYEGEAAGLAESGRTVSAFVSTFDSLDVDTARRYCHRDFRVFSPPGTFTLQERTLEEFFDWLRERASQVASVRNFSPVYRWVSPNFLVARGDVRASGCDGEHYTWARIYVIELRDGLVVSFHQFADEDAAFAYAEHRAKSAPSRLVTTNRTSEAADRLMRHLCAGEADDAVERYRDDYRFQDSRPLSGDPLRGKHAMRAAIEGILRQYAHFSWGVVAVRGQSCSMGWSRWSDELDNQSAHLHVLETDAGGHIIFDGRFDEGDFGSAYAELERRYYAGEGKAFARSGIPAANFVAAMNSGDLDTMFGTMTTQDLLVENHSRSGFPDRSAAELRASLEALGAMLTSVRSWFAALRWMSPDVAVGRLEREGRGHDGEDYAWVRLLVIQYRDGLLSSIHDFDADHEDAAFACARSLR